MTRQTPDTNAHETPDDAHLNQTNSWEYDESIVLINDIRNYGKGISTGQVQHWSLPAIAKSVWHLADGMEKKVVAEGVETCDECLDLKSFGYRIGQGYRYGKPMAEDAFLAHLAAWQAEQCPCPVA